LIALIKQRNQRRENALVVDKSATLYIWWSCSV